MYKNILIPVALDHSRDTGAAIAIARRLLADGGKMTALHVLESLPGYASAYLPDEVLEGRRSETQDKLRAEIGVDDIRSVVIEGHSGRSILEYAADHDIDCIVIASHRPGLQDYLLGSTAARVVRHAACAVHVTR